MRIFDFNPPIIAHRGASAYAPENTLVAFIKAAQMGAKWVELDIMQSASGELVVFHDEDLSRTTNGIGELTKCSYDYLQTLDAGKWFDAAFAGERIPSLQHILPLFYNTSLSINIEIKAQAGKEEMFIKQLKKEINEYLIIFSNRILFSSFSIKSLQYLHAYLPNAYFGILIDDSPNHLNENIFHDPHCVSIHLNEQLIIEKNIKFIKEIKEKNKILLAYTVNCKKRAEQLFSLGVDAIFTDKPDILLGMHA